MRIKQTTLGALLNQINGLAGASALSAASICSDRQTFVQAGLGENTVYLYTYEAAEPAMVEFLKGEGDTVLATGSLMLNEEFACDSQAALEGSLPMFSATVAVAK